MDEKRNSSEEQPGPRGEEAGDDPADGTGETDARTSDRDHANAYYGAFRSAGPEEMQDPQEGLWDIVDEGSDASFPASDPPSYMGGVSTAAPAVSPPDPESPREADERDPRKTEPLS